MNYLKVYNQAFKKAGYNGHTHREPRYLFTVKNVIKSNIKSLIDIGTGHGILLKILHHVNFQTALTAVDVNNFHKLRYVNHIIADITNDLDREKIQGKYDILTCLDCLEHIEESQIDDVLQMFSGLSDEFLFSVANHSDILDGVELHLIQKESIWWSNKLTQYFDIVYFESLIDDKLYLYRCKAKKVWKSTKDNRAKEAPRKLDRININKPDKIKYSILMPYYKRDVQLFSTLQSFANFYADRKDYEIIIIEDAKSNDLDRLYLSMVLKTFDFLNIKRIQGTTEESFSPATNYNIGSKQASGDFFILTNPENMHKVDILSGLDQIFNESENSYIVCSCLSVNHKSLSVSKINNIEGKWYQHSEIRNTGCHFLSAISRENYFKVGGFSKELSAGVGYDDDDFRNKVQKFGIPFIYRDDLPTFHLFHPQASPDMGLFHKNQKIYHEKWGQSAFSAGQLPVV